MIMGKRGADYISFCFHSQLLLHLHGVELKNETIVLLDRCFE